MAYRIFRFAVINIKPRILVCSIGLQNHTCSLVNQVVLIEAGSLIEAGGSDIIVLIEAGGFY